jgi:16S rRNA (guanine527-N7)-methyltransferase
MTDRLDDSQIAGILRPYYTYDLSNCFCDQIRSYIDLLLRWNRRMSLTTVTDPFQILRFHFGESLFAIAQVPIRHGRLADVGSGAGFPAVPIRMALGDVSLTLIESNRKKCAFLSEVVRELGLGNVIVYPGRMEEIGELQSQLDFVTARAVAIDETVLAWAASSLKPEGSAVLWVGQDESTRISLTNRFHWRPPVKIPDSDRRFLLIGGSGAAPSRRSM